MKSDFPINLTENLNRLLKRDRRSLASIAKELGINKSTLHNWQNGVTPQSLVSLVRLAAYFDVPVVELIFEKNRHQILHQISIEQNYEVIIRKIDHKKEKSND